MRIASYNNTIQYNNLVLKNNFLQNRKSDNETRNINSDTLTFSGSGNFIKYQLHSRDIDKFKDFLDLKSRFLSFNFSSYKTCKIFPKPATILSLENCPNSMTADHLKEIDMLKKMGITNIKTSIKDLKELEDYSGAILTEKGFAIMENNRITKLIVGDKVIETKIPKIEEIKQDEHNLKMTKVNGEILTLESDIATVLRDPDGEKVFIEDGKNISYIKYNDGTTKDKPSSTIKHSLPTTEFRWRTGRFEHTIEFYYESNPAYNIFCEEYNNLKTKIFRYLKDINMFGILKL